MPRDEQTSGSGRRDFLKATGVIGLGLSVTSTTQAGEANPPVDSIAMRPLGKTGQKVSVIGLGGHHLGAVADVELAIRIVHEAVDAGVNFFDNCWEYENGKSENWLGRALEGRRDKVILMTKVCTHGRGKELALKMLDESLRRLKTDHLDLWQIHGVAFDNDPALAYAKGGVLEAFDLAKKQGKVRFVGFTGHKDPNIHLEMIRRGYPFDTVQMPLNIFDASFRSFETQVLPELASRGIGALGMKSMNGTAEAAKQAIVTPEEMLRYAMSLPVATTVVGVDSLDILHQNLKIAQGFQPLSADAMNSLRERCRDYAGDGRFETYKISLRYDNPQARLAHGFPLDETQKEVQQMLFEEAGSP
jgi:aryl-alcohol dehydrogenase-like predicted oxidoreductase